MNRRARTTTPTTKERRASGHSNAVDRVRDAIDANVREPRRDGTDVTAANAQSGQRAMGDVMIARGATTALLVKRYGRYRKLPSDLCHIGPRSIA
jgi:hypothetical protein